MPLTVLYNNSLFGLLAHLYIKALCLNFFSLFILQHLFECCV